MSIHSNILITCYSTLVQNWNVYSPSFEQQTKGSVAQASRNWLRQAMIATDTPTQYTPLRAIVFPEPNNRNLLELLSTFKLFEARMFGCILSNLTIKYFHSMSSPSQMNGVILERRATSDCHDYFIAQHDECYSSMFHYLYLPPVLNKSTNTLLFVRKHAHE